ncbi:hypothetical protein PR048_012544 [Dryococelus australis]|uniref:DDE-1 domain-containing protein n=1 Tax=Dryococelus australis TaxID=614101 RepID=A0ABQ9HPP2_9NEOP|nr:hypothetical protein PR048_012544 [Dryococelus australis]
MAKVGRPFALASEIDTKFAKYVIRMQELGLNLTVFQIRKLAYDLAKKIGSIDRFNVEKEVAGKKCYRESRERYNLNIRRPENLSRYHEGSFMIAYKKCCLNTSFYILLTEFESVMKPDFSLRGCAERGTTTTILCSANAAYKSGPILVIFKCVQNIFALIDGAHVDATVAVSPKGWITSELFLQWLHIFILSLLSPIPVLSLMDSHSSYISPEDLQMAEDNKISILTFSSHKTYLLQPLDVSVFASLTSAWRNTLEKCTRRNPGKSPSWDDSHSLFTPSHEKRFMPQVIKVGFRKWGYSHLTAIQSLMRQQLPLVFPTEVTVKVLANRFRKSLS